MSAVVGVDLSSHAIDLVKLDEDSNRAEWVRCELAGKDAWERTLNIREALVSHLPQGPSAWFADVFLTAIEAPYGRGQAGTTAILNRVVGAIAASLPAALRSPERCWIVRPDEWKQALGLKGKPTGADLARIVGDGWDWPTAKHATTEDEFYEHVQNYYDAYALALFARDTNARAVDAALAAEGNTAA